MIAVTVKQNGSEVGFKFNNSAFNAAMEFVQTCMETADYGTKVTIEQNEEQED